MLLALWKPPFGWLLTVHLAVGRALRWGRHHWLNAPAITAWATILLAVVGFGPTYTWWLDRRRRNLNIEQPGIQAAAIDQQSRIGKQMPIETKLIKEFDPVYLGVHSAVEVDSAAELAEPPIYVPRAHDDWLRTKIGSLNQSAMVVLIGDSSTGKTRALWEAIQSLPEDWQLCYTGGPAKPQAVLTALTEAWVGPHTVLWMDKLSDFLDTSPGVVGEQIAAALRKLLHDPGCRPVIILGTLWLNEWEALTASQEREHTASHPEAHSLLESAKIKRVPDEFSDTDLRSLADISDRDDRLALAREQGGARITQFLAGIFQLMQTYDTALPLTRAVIDAAIDVRRLGQLTRIPEAFLHDAAPGYVNNHTWNQHGRGRWFTKALRRAAQPRLGVPGPLERIIPRPGQRVPHKPEYALHDYLDQHGRKTRLMCVPPPSFWESAAHRITASSDLFNLVQDARQRHYYRIAVLLGHRAAEAGNVPAMLDLADVLAETGRAAEAMAWRQRAFDVSSDSGLTMSLTAWQVASQLQQDGRRDEATPWWRRAVEVAGSGMSDLGPALAAAGRIEEAERWLGDAAGAGDLTAARALIVLFERRRCYDEAIIWARHAVEMGEDDVRSNLAWLLEETGQLEEAITQRQIAAETGDAYEMMRLSELLERRGRSVEASQWVRRAAEQGSKSAIKKLAEPLEQLGHFEEAAELWKFRAQGGNYSALSQVSELYEKASKLDEAMAVWLPRAQAGDATAMLSLGQLLRRAGKTDQAKVWLYRAVESGHTYGRKVLCEMLEQAGHITDAVSVWESAIRAGEPGASNHLASLLERQGQFADAEHRLLIAAKSGDRNAMLQLSDFLERVHRNDEADEWLERAARAGNPDAIRRLASSLEDAGKFKDAARLCLSADLTESRLFYRATKLLDRAGKAVEAETYLRHALETGRSGAWFQLRTFLEEKNHNEYERLARYGIEPGGETSPEW